MGSDQFSGQYNPNWETKKVKDVAVVNEQNISSCDNYHKIEYIEISNVNKGEISEIPIINFDEAPTRAKRKVKQNDILISTVRPNLEHYSFIKSANSNTIASTGFAVITAQDIEPRFLYYVLTSQKYTDYFSMIAEGHTSAYPAMNPDVIENAQIPVPPKNEQKRIAHILGTLDDKIELNQRMNETLEAIARAIFKSWFVDFDPVKAKMAGEPYPLPDAVMALFPDELVESELGMIPKGWEVKSLSEVSEITKGVSYRSEELSGNEFALVNLKSINRGGGYRLDGLKPFCGTFKSEQEVRHGDIIIAYTDVTQAAELLGRPARVQNVDNTRLIASLDIGIVRSEILPKEFLYFTLNSYRFNEYAKNHANGTTVLHLSRKDVPKFRTVIPSKIIVNKFSNICNPLFKIIDSNNYQNNVLPFLRDELIHLFLQN